MFNFIRLFKWGKGIEEGEREGKDGGRKTGGGVKYNFLVNHKGKKCCKLNILLVKLKNLEIEYFVSGKSNGKLIGEERNILMSRNVRCKWAFIILLLSIYILIAIVKTVKLLFTGTEVSWLRKNNLGLSFIL